MATIAYHNTYRDYATYNLFYGMRLLIIIGLIVLIFGARSNWSEVDRVASDHSWVFRWILFILLELVPVILAAAAGLAVILIGSGWSRLMGVRFSGGTLTLSGRAILAESASASFDLPWKSVRLAHRTRHFIFIQIKKHGNLLIPRRAFQGQEEYNRFWEVIETYKNGTDAS
jgi:hypothetical protein